MRAQPHLSDHPLRHYQLRHYLKLLLVCLALAVSNNLVAEDEEADGETPQSRYMEIEPAFVTNFGGPGRLRYMKVEVTLRVTGMDGEAQVNHHLPAIKDALLSLFAIQTSESIGSAEGKEALRQASLKAVQDAVIAEDETSYIEDLLFTSFVAHQ